LFFLPPIVYLQVRNFFPATSCLTITFFFFLDMIFSPFFLEGAFFSVQSPSAVCTPFLFLPSCSLQMFDSFFFPVYLHDLVVGFFLISTRRWCPLFLFVFFAVAEALYFPFVRRRRGSVAVPASFFGGTKAGGFLFQLRRHFWADFLPHALLLSMWRITPCSALVLVSN